MFDAIDIVNISIKEKERVLYEEEGHFFEVKSKDISPAKLTETLSAFANTAGGELYIGLDEYRRRNKKTRKWNGFTDQESANGHLQAFEQTFPLSSDFSYVFLACEGSDGLVLRADIHKVREVKVASNQKPYIRRGAQNLPVDTPQKLRCIEYNKGITSFETELVNVDVDEILGSPILASFLAHSVATSDSLTFLRKQHLVISGKPAVAAVLLFAEQPQAILPKRCAIKICRYHTRDTHGDRDTLSDEIVTIEGCTCGIIRDAVDTVVRMVESVPVLGQGRLDSIRYPDETLHEIITNAVLHRDYSVLADIQIRIFDNRIEIESPGRLAGHITEKNILNEQCSRNAYLVRLASKFPDPPNRDIGEGLTTAFEAMRRLKLRLPEIKENENSVTVYIFHEPLASTEDMILKYLDEHATINNTEARIITGNRSENSVKKAFDRLRKQGLIELVPDRRGASSAWQKIGKAKRDAAKQLGFDLKLQ